MPAHRSIPRNEIVHLSEAAVAVALSVLLGNVRLVELPHGGSVALATVPLLALACVRGPRLGVLAGGCGGIAHALSGGTIVHPVQVGLDYFMAYAALGCAGIAVGRGTSRAHLAPAIVLAMALHLTAMVVSGMVFFSTVAGSAAFEYALAYNALTVVPETLLAIWLVPMLVRAAARANPADAWRRSLLDPPRPTRRTPRRHVVATRPIGVTRSTDMRAPKLTGRLTRRGVSRPESPSGTSSRTSFVRPTPFS